LTHKKHRKQIKRELKNSLLESNHEEAEGGMTKEDFDNMLKQSKPNEEGDLVGLDVFSDPHTRELFDGLCNQFKIPTNDLQIVSAVLSLDSKYALCIVQDVSDSENDRFELRAYNVETMNKSPTWSVEYNGINMTMKHIDQNNEGKMFALPYQDNGKYFISIIDQVQGKEIHKIDVNKHVQFDK